MPNFAAILAAAGKSSRFGHPEQKKPFVLLRQKPVWQYSADLFSLRDDVKQILLVISREDDSWFQKQFPSHPLAKIVTIVHGGSERADSVQNALESVADGIDFVAIHDAARPCVDVDLIDRVFEAASRHDAVIPAVPITSTIKRVDPQGQILETVDRAGLYQAQTPQVYRLPVLMDLYRQRDGANVTDEAQLAERHGVPVHVVAGSPLNIKITERRDLQFAACCLETMMHPHFDSPIDPGNDRSML